LLFAVCCTLPTPAAPQALPAGPVALADGRFVLGADLAATAAPEDPGFFNYSDYEHSTLRQLRLGLTASFEATSHLTFLGELRSENFSEVEAFALFARIRPWRTRRFDIQVGRIPPTFGSFTRRAYGHQNPLIGYPLAYQYLTSLRPDAVPANAEELLRMRGRGWLSSFGIGDQTPARGLPLVTVFSWDTGVQINTGWRGLDVTASITNGSASNPRVGDDNDGKQVAARLSAQPRAGLAIGASFARGAFVDRRVLHAGIIPADSSTVQQALGLDVEVARDRWLARTDVVLSEWTLPVVGSPAITKPLQALAMSLEGRYTFLPGVYAAARAEHLTFSRLAPPARPVPWEAAVTRIEIGGGYYIQRNVVARVSLQMNRRDGGRVRSANLPAVQLLYWF